MHEGNEETKNEQRYAYEVGTRMKNSRNERYIKKVTCSCNLLLRYEGQL